MFTCKVCLHAAAWAVEGGRSFVACDSASRLGLAIECAYSRLRKRKLRGHGDANWGSPGDIAALLQEHHEALFRI